MKTNLPDFTEVQRQAFLDLLLLAIYADGHLTSFEDARVERLLTALGWTDAYDRQQQFDASVTRVRPYAEVPERARTHAVALARSFTSREQRLKVYAALEEVISSDGHITSFERQFLELIRGTFRL